MIFDQAVMDHLKGRTFTTGLHVAVSDGTGRYQPKFAYLQNLLRHRSVIDFGCADHAEVIQRKVDTGKWLHAKICEAAEHCVGLDINADSLKVAKECGFEDLYCCDIFRDPLPPAVTGRHFDYFFLGEVLEHQGDPVTFLRRIREKFGGIADSLLLTVPNATGREYFLHAGRGREVINTDHRLWFTPFTLAKALTDAGFAVQDFDYVHSGGRVRSLWRRFVLSRHPAWQNTIVMRASFSSGPD